MVWPNSALILNSVLPPKVGLKTAGHLPDFCCRTSCEFPPFQKYCQFKLFKLRWHQHSNQQILVWNHFFIFPLDNPCPHISHVALVKFVNFFAVQFTLLESCFCPCGQEGSISLLGQAIFFSPLQVSFQSCLWLDFALICFHFFGNVSPAKVCPISPANLLQWF